MRFPVRRSGAFGPVADVDQCTPATHQRTIGAVEQRLEVDEELGLEGTLAAFCGNPQTITGTPTFRF